MTTTATEPYLAVGNNHGWGRGRTADAAIRTMKGQGGNCTEFKVWRCVPGCYVDEINGGIFFPIGQLPVMEQHRVKRGNRWQDHG